MATPRSRLVVAAATAALSLAGFGPGAITSAADSPEGVVSQLLEMIRSRDLSTVNQIVCADKRDTARRVLDIASEMDLDADPTLLDELSIELSDITITVTANDGETAEVSITGTMRMSYPEDQVEDLVRASLGEDAGPDELAYALPLMESILNGTLPVDEQATVILEQGEWLVCGGFDLDRPQLPGFEPSVSSEGLCAFVSPEELSSVGDLSFDSSNGFESFCNYSTADFESFHAVAVNVFLDEDAEAQGGYVGVDQPLEVAGAPAWSSGEGSFMDSLLVQAGPDVLQVTVTPPESPPDGWDRLAYSVHVAELFLPVVAEYREQVEASLPEPTPLPTPEPSLCELLPLDAANDAFGLGLDETTGDRYYCSYDQIDGEPGWHHLQVSLIETTLDEARTWMTAGEDTTVAELPALRDASLLVIQLPGDAWTLQLSGWVDENDPSVTLTLEEVQEMLAAAYVPLIEVPEPTRFEDFGFDDVGEPTLPRPLCDYVDLDAVNALGVLEFGDVAAPFPDYCTLSQLDPEQGFHQTTIIVSPFTMEDLDLFLPDSTELSIAGHAARLGPNDLHVELPATVLTFNVFLPEQATIDGITAADVLVPLAELVVAAIGADTGG